MTKKTDQLILVLLVLSKFLLQYFAIDSGYELHRDEYLHLDLGKHLAWGYISVPPVTSWISLVIYHLGNSVFWVKFFPALFGAITIWLVWEIVRILNGGRFALVLSAVCVTFSVLVRINTLYQPNSLEYLMWTLVFYFVVRYVDSDNHKYLWLAAVSFALGFLNKYNIIFLALGMLPALILTSQRSVFLKPQLYLALLLALLIVLPNLVWQFQNDFPVIVHLTELSNRQLVNVDRLDFLKTQFLFFPGAIAVLLAAFISFFKYPGFRKYTFIFWCFVITMAMYIYLRAKDYYTIGLYPVMLAFGSVYMEHLLSRGRLVYLRPVLLLIPVVTLMAIFKIVLPVLPPEKIVQNHEEFQRLGLLRWEDGKDHQLPQDFADMLGWKELAEIVDSAFQRVHQKEKTLIHCDNYGQAGAINFYSTESTHDAVTLHADYINWYPLDQMEILNVILVQTADDDDPGREREKALFDEVIYVRGISNRYAREYGTQVYLLLGAKQSINDILSQEIQDRKLPATTDR